MKYRNEWKYICEDGDLNLIENKLSKVLRLDPHANEDGKYRIHSLYFDDAQNTCMYDNDAGLGKRFKYRIRYYNDDNSVFFLERKEKFNGLCRKESCKLTREQFENIINNNISEVFWSTDNKTLKKFCIDVQTKLFKPKVIIDYERTAYVEPITNVRITFDRNISCSLELDKFLTEDYVHYPLQDKDKHVLEIKFDDILPGYVRQSVQQKRLVQTTFSKYYLSRAIVERN